jgi:hypothetical protein
VNEVSVHEVSLNIVAGTTGVKWRGESRRVQGQETKGRGDQSKGSDRRCVRAKGESGQAGTSKGSGRVMVGSDEAPRGNGDGGGPSARQTEHRPCPLQQEDSRLGLAHPARKNVIRQQSQGYRGTEEVD